MRFHGTRKSLPLNHRHPVDYAFTDYNSIVNVPSVPRHVGNKQIASHRNAGPAGISALRTNTDIHERSHCPGQRPLDTCPHGRHLTPLDRGRLPQVLRAHHIARPIVIVRKRNERSSPAEPVDDGITLRRMNQTVLVHPRPPRQLKRNTHHFALGRIHRAEPAVERRMVHPLGKGISHGFIA